jgi:DNA/RNA endonuclease YhcR with UshA esterase domain
MEDEKIFKIALLTALFGLTGMILFAGQIMPQKVQIKDINRGMLDREVSVEGVVQGVERSQKGESYFLDFMDGTGKMKLIIFEGTALDIQKQNMSIMNFNRRRIKAVGRVTEYQGNMELVLKDARSLQLVA